MKFFTEQARAAAAIARKKKAELKAQTQTEMEVFAIRIDNVYKWQLRKFGGIILASGDQSFTSADAARAAGTSALVQFSPDGPGGRN